ncbi:MAG: DUF7873 family protein [Promethearchaeota archaeon]|jgi:hypothetical protein
MPKLHQIVAVTQGKKSRATRHFTDCHRAWHKDAISGIQKKYTPKEDGGDELPAESKLIHLDVPSAIRDMMLEIVDFIDVVATQETGNREAKADIEVDGKAVFKDVPVTVLLFLEKRLVDLRTYVGNLPTLPPDREWKWDSNRNCFVTDEIKTLRTQKRPKVITKAPATVEHPAQTELFPEDVTVGTWSTTYLSSAIQVSKKAAMLRRIDALSDAVKSAREAANSIEVKQERIGERFLRDIFGDLMGKRDE